MDCACVFLRRHLARNQAAAALKRLQSMMKRGNLHRVDRS